MSKKKYYKILGISYDATDKEIKKAYHKLALKYHPDRNSDEQAEQKFKEIREAYAVLSGKEKPPVKVHKPRRYPGYTWADDVARTWSSMQNEQHNNMYR
jgi:hypothetical protein